MNKKKSNHYQKYLASVHGDWITPDEVIYDVVKEGTDKEVASKKRIITGEANEVYDITLKGGKHVILRVSTSGYPNFLQEKWAIGKVKKLGVPVPEIILIKYLTIEGKEKSLCLMEKVEGEPLERGNIDFGKLDLNTRKSLINQAGKLLAKIHSVKTEGFGWIIGAGKSEFKTSDEWLDNLINQREQFEKMAAEEDIDKQVIVRAIRIIRSFKGLYSKIIPHLNHGDFGHKHFMVTDNKITCILDWGGVRSDTPVSDFAWWDYWFGEFIPTEWLKEGYTNKSLFDNHFEDFLHLLRLFRGLETLSWYHKQKYKPAVKKAKVKLSRDLKYFKE